ncbi:uncharacterized protein ASPGLDRAFT_32819 [Aspergillus glaucus CBS 516.65]|uniref:YCII-related domain-containing protein n=1 Tax=Aspergillus glaucus CBS 516.65 TaxID=1160497 RepID=A0A1L9VT44_ASPGL|nr:hypothetical protein ASPGLDRAFT_32819 [Aspergillus glaucus CBS 516.65]OJJ87091.1 hypothetical protein ASPGLDRAFT_32819 [Aspergillus glaucus CBS 516.65]
MSAPAKKEFLCICPDKPGVIDKRLEVRPQHLENAKKSVSEGSLVLGGAMFNDSHPKEGETPSFKGSAMMLLAENEEEARKLLENDVYTKNGVWDIENVQIIPFQSAVRLPL